MKTLVTDIKESKIFDDQIIFQAIQFNVAKEVLKQEILLNDVRFIQRGFSSYFDFKHFDLSIELGKDLSEMVASSNNFYL